MNTVPSIELAQQSVQNFGQALQAWTVFSGNFYVTVTLMLLGLSAAIALVTAVFQFWTRA